MNKTALLQYKVKLTVLNVMETATVSTRHYRNCNRIKNNNNKKIYSKQPSINLVLTGQWDLIHKSLMPHSIAKSMKFM